MCKSLFTPEQELEICEMYEHVERARIVADAFGSSGQTIYRILDKHGIKRTHRHPKPKSTYTGNRHKGINHAQVCEMYRSGHSVHEIAKCLGCSDSNVYHHLKREGLYWTGKRKDEIDALTPRVLELHNEGRSDYEIADVLGVARHTVNDRIRKAGIRRGRGSNSHKGGAVIHERAQKAAIERFDSVREQFELIEYTNADHATVRCRTCGCEFNWCRDTWDAIEKCPTCRDRKAEIERSRRRASKIYNAAAREWLLSTPRVCNECGEPFYSEYDNARYCCESCRKKSKNRRTTNRRKKRGAGSGSYGRRLKVKKSKSTYDRTVTRAAVFKKYRGKCCNCGCKTYLNGKWSWQRAELDHVIALGNNGTHTWNNVQLLCARCNNEKADTGQIRLAI